MSAVSVRKVGFVLFAISYLDSMYLSFLAFKFLMKSEYFQNAAAATPLSSVKSLLKLNRK